MNRSEDKELSGLRSYGDTLSDAVFVLLNTLDIYGTIKSTAEEVRRVRLAMDRYDGYRGER